MQAGFPEGVWVADVAMRYPQGSPARGVADDSRRVFEQHGVPEAELLLCEAEGPDGTRLADCVKVYLPLGARQPSERPFGMVFVDVGREEAALVMLAFGVRRRVPGDRRSISLPIAAFTHTDR